MYEADPSLRDSVLENLAGTMSQIFFLGQSSAHAFPPFRERRSPQRSLTHLCISPCSFSERAVTLVRLKLRPAGWVLLAFCVPSILAGLSLGLAGVIVGFAVSLVG